MTWKNRYSPKKVVDTVNGIPIFAGGYYIIESGSTELMRVPAGKSPTESDGYIVKINWISENLYRVNFNNRTGPRMRYIWSNVYRGYIVRQATPQEEKRLENELAR